MSLIVVLTNQSHLAPVSDYYYKAMVGDGTEKGSDTIATGRIEQHTRADGWKALVRRLLDQA